MNPFIPGEVTIAMETGSLYLWSENASLQVVKKCSACVPEDFDWYFCEFGTHPRQILYCNKTNVELLDLRVLLTLAPATCKGYICSNFGNIISLNFTTSLILGQFLWW